MANKHLTKKLDTYHSLFQINRAFRAIQAHCRILEETGFLPAPKMRVFCGLSRELQSLISHDVVDKMHDIEDRDCFEYGKTRIAWEHYLNSERPAFQSRPNPERQ
jgi:hypothetical protein